MLTFVEHGRQFKADSLTNWKPMQISKNGSDMVVFPCVRDKSSSCILDTLQLDCLPNAVGKQPSIPGFILEENGR